MRFGAAAACALLVSACGGAGSPKPATLPGVSSRAPTISPHAARCAPQAGGFPDGGTLAAPFVTAMAWSPDGRLFLAERSGTIAVYQDGGLRTFAQVATVTTEPGGGYSERGLLGLALSPSFSSDRRVYAFWSLADRTGQVVGMWQDCAGRAEDAQTLLSLPAGPDCCHKGGRLAFGPDGMLYVSVGDEHDAPSAQDTSDLRGKILRYAPDGTAAPGNPFGNPVWAYGLRNVFGLTFTSAGQLIASVNGPSNDAGTPCSACGDLLLEITRGGAYQWPLCWGYGHPIPPHADCGGQPDPPYSTERTGAFVAPTGITWVDDRGPAALRQSLVFCSLSGGRVAQPAAPRWTVRDWMSGCLYDVVEGPDGALYYSDAVAVHRVT